MVKVRAALAAMLLLLAFASPALGAGFPDQGKPQSCEVLFTLPVNIIGHLDGVSPQTAARLATLLNQACGG